MTHLNVTNHSLSVGCIQMTAVASASVLQVGDTEQMTLYSMFDTPPESIIVGPLAPLGEPLRANKAEGE
ncbi:putative spore germination protein GerPD [Paenibacillus baekrokdamisoli]|uniref:Putative spore germination protein GerPD n=1 Tax=Paenibacillus baekrokdamisoli TaxID=1712516 RepID=A0A3G9J953_9BACL|nr:spore gernimation protein GerPD [Paenibacillus baekrokdamisoli]MBB3067219.1 spore germination protein PD [Paenibacillus baekrokdamisoli]BBH19589.1 putative spore germination protein GerPD [Paenibacillus baekrokdamisoli]